MRVNHVQRRRWSAGPWAILCHALSIVRRFLFRPSIASIPLTILLDAAGGPCLMAAEEVSSTIATGTAVREMSKTEGKSSRKARLEELLAEKARLDKLKLPPTKLAPYGDVATNAKELGASRPFDALSCKALILAAQCFQRQVEDGKAVAVEDKLVSVSQQIEKPGIAATYLLAAGKQHMIERGYVHAERYFATILREFPTEPVSYEATLRLGYCYKRLDRGPDAVATWRRLVLSPAEAEPWRREALLSLFHDGMSSLKRTERPKFLVELAKESSDADVAARCRLLAGVVLLRTGKPEDAVSQFQEARRAIRSDVEQRLCDKYIGLAERRMANQK